MKICEFYQEEPGSSFTHDGKDYLLNPLVKFADKIPIRELPVTDLKWILDVNPHDKYYDQRVEDADISIPLLVCKWNDRYVVLDGLHRLAKAVELNKKVISVKLIGDKLLSYFEI